MKRRLFAHTVWKEVTSNSLVLHAFDFSVGLVDSIFSMHSGQVKVLGKMIEEIQFTGAQ